MQSLRISFMAAASAAILALSPSAIAQHSTKVARPMDDRNNVVDNTLDSLNKAKFARPISGSSRKGDNPVLFLVGNSTMRTRNSWQWQQWAVGLGMFP